MRPRLGILEPHVDASDGSAQQDPVRAPESEDDLVERRCVALLRRRERLLPRGLVNTREVGSPCASPEQIRTPDDAEVVVVLAQSQDPRLFVMEFPSGEESYYAWSYDRYYDTMVKLRRESFLKAWHFMCAAVTGSTIVVPGVVASEPDDDACIPMGTTVELVLAVAPGRNPSIDMRHAA